MCTIQVGVSVFKILLHVTRPNTMAMGNIPGTQIYQNLSRYREALRIPSFLVLAIEAPIYFANSTYLQERLVRFQSSFYQKLFPVTVVYKSFTISYFIITK